MSGICFPWRPDMPAPAFRRTCALHFAADPIVRRAQDAVGRRSFSDCPGKESMLSCFFCRASREYFVRKGTASALPPVRSESYFLPAFRFSPPQRIWRFFARPFCKKAASPRRSATYPCRSVPARERAVPLPSRCAQRPARHNRRLAFATARVARTRLFLRRSALLLPFSRRARRPARGGSGRAFFAHGGKTGRGGRLPTLGFRPG